MDSFLRLLVFIIAAYMVYTCIAHQQNEQPRVITGGAWGRSRQPPKDGGCGCW